jgi:type I restriction enzyme, S subunit
VTLWSYFQRLESFVTDPSNVHGLRRAILGLAVGGHLDDPLDANRSCEEAGTEYVEVREVAAQALQVSSLTCKFDRLSHVAELKKGLTPIKSAKPGSFPLVVTADERVSCDHYDYEEAAAIIPMVSSSGHGNASIKRLHYQSGRFALGTILCAAFPRDPKRISARFLYEYLTAFKDELLVSQMVGTANVTLTLEKIGQVPVPLISEAALEQLDKLMTLCDQLEFVEKQRASRRDALRKTSLKRLNDADGDGLSRKENVGFFLNMSRRLITERNHVTAVRQAIIDLAVHGRLVPQDPCDEPASTLLEVIERKKTEIFAAKFPNAAEARAQLKKSGEQRLPSNLPTVPVGWKWATLMQCSAIVVDCRNKTVPYTSTGITLLRTTNVRDGQIILQDHRYVSEETYQIWTSRYQPQPGDIVITREAPMGQVAKIPVGMRVCLGQRLMLSRLVEETIDADFLVYSLRDSNLMERVQDKPIGATVEHLRVGGVETLLVPVPPLAEQHRIVAKVNELLSWCDDLETALSYAQRKRSRLLEALLREALSEAAPPP